MSRSISRRTAGLGILAGFVAPHGAIAERSNQVDPTCTLRVESVSKASVQPQAADPATIFHDDFERADAPDSRYFEYGAEGKSFIRRSGEGMSGGAAMRCQFEQGQVSAGSLKVLFGTNPFGKGIRRKEFFRDIYWRVYVKHEAGWSGNPAKLGRATCLAGADWSQGMIGHVWGGKGEILCIDPATGIRDGKKVTVKYNDFDHLRWLGLRNGITPIFSTAESGRWVCVESHVRLNTPGASDGVFELWVDGVREAARNDLDWHGTWVEYGINAVFLENYWNTGSIKRQARWFDDFIISTAPIGPITAAQPVAFTCTAGHAAAWEAQISTRPEEGGVVWSSAPVKGNGRSLRVNSGSGAFIGARSNKRDLAANTLHWIRLRERTPAGSWSNYSEWHAPFRTA